MITCNTPWQIILLHISIVIRPSNREYGFLCKSYSLGGSVAKANAARVSMIKFTHNI